MEYFVRWRWILIRECYPFELYSYRGRILRTFTVRAPWTLIHTIVLDSFFVLYVQKSNLLKRFGWTWISSFHQYATSSSTWEHCLLISFVIDIYCWWFLWMSDDSWSPWAPWSKSGFCILFRSLPHYIVPDCFILLDNLFYSVAIFIPFVKVFKLVWVSKCNICRLHWWWRYFIESWNILIRCFVH